MTEEHREVIVDRDSLNFWIGGISAQLKDIRENQTAIFDRLKPLEDVCVRVDTIETHHLETREADSLRFKGIEERMNGRFNTQAAQRTKWRTTLLIAGCNAVIGISALSASFLTAWLTG